MNPRPCPDCNPAGKLDDSLTRRAFIKQSAGSAAALSAGALIPGLAEAAKPKGTQPPSDSSSETLVKTLYDSLNDGQRDAVCFPFDHPRRLEVDNNWHITKTAVSDFARDQQEMIREIFMGLHSPEYADKVYRQVVHDSGRKGFESSSIALFGEPGEEKFEFVLTGRHCTRRCDGDSVKGAAFGGPIFYGHAAESFNEGPKHKGNVYWFQAKRANEVFQMFDGKQREMALLDYGRRERGTDTVKLTGKKSGLDGIPVSELTSDQKDLTRKVMHDLLAPFRESDRTESMKYVEANGFDNLHLAFYQMQDIGDDGVWDVWQIEGPSMVWYFRGKPHVHAWAHIRESAFESGDPFNA